MSILDRICLLLGDAEQQDLTSHLKLNKTAFSDWKSGKSNSYRKYLIEIAEFLNVSLDYLVYGEEKSSSPDYLSDDERELLEKYKMLEDKDRIRVQERVDAIIDIRKAEKPKPELIRRPARRTLKIDLYDTPVSAGTGVYLDNDSRRKIKIVATPEAEKADFALRVTGDSMEPDFSDGDIVLVRNVGAVDIGQVGVFMANNEGYIKMFRGDRLCSLNEKYDDIELNEYIEGRCCGPVLGKLDEDEIIDM